LDLLCYLLGSPSRVFAWTRNLLHHIETEDTIHALLAWPNGLLGSLHISTAEADEAERLKIVGTQGSLEIGHGRLLAHTLEMDVRDYARLQTHPYASLARTPQTITLPPGQADHVAVYRSFHAALLQQPSDYCDGFQARQELEVANAIVYSNYLHREVTLPLDPSAYRTLLSELQTP
jgi:predicted dehydrogenase